MSDFCFIQINPETIAVGSGELIRSHNPHDTRPSFYRNDFFLTDSQPWIIPEHYSEMPVSQFRQQFTIAEKQNDTVVWESNDDQKFRKFFQKVKLAIEEGLLEKIVPVSFENGAIPASWGENALQIFSRRLIRYLSSDLYLFGIQLDGQGMCGLTPELIFEQHHAKIVSAALAGTKSSQFGDRSIKNPKDMREHELVITDIVEAIKPFGTARVSETVPYWNGSLIHLRAKIELSTDKHSPLHFEELVQAIHPTAALGVYPRTPNSAAILKGSDVKIPREYFAAPFGLYKPLEQHALCVAAIRSLFWKGSEVRIGAGCGVIEESDVESEISELALKRKSIKDKIIPET